MFMLHGGRLHVLKHQPRTLVKCTICLNEIDPSYATKHKYLQGAVPVQTFGGCGTQTISFAGAGAQGLGEDGGASGDHEIRRFT